MKENKKRVFYIPTIEEEDVKIPRIEDEPIKNEDPSSVFVSPILGRQKNQSPLPPGVEVRGNKGLRYESFRNQNDKRHQKNDLKKDYGTEYFEFNGIYTSEQAKEYLKTGVLRPIRKSEPEKEPAPIISNDEVIVFDEEHLDDQKNINEFFEEKRNVDTSPVYYYPNNVKDYYSSASEVTNHTPPIKDTPKPSPKPVVTKQRHGYTFPSLSLLESGKEDKIIDTDWLDEQAAIIDDTLRQFNIGGQVINYVKGPSVTQFQISLNAGVNVKEVNKIADNLKMNLSATEIRLQIPVPGKNYGGIEVPNKIRETVFLGDLIKNEEFLQSDDKLLVALGIDLGGQYVYSDIHKMPHGLIAGMTGSGKSVCINSVLISLLYKNTPEELRLILIDPKMVELAAYDEIPHLATPVITDTKMAAAALRWVVEEMENRFNTFKSYRVRDIKSYNELMMRERQTLMPRIVIIIDELADLMIVAASEVESNIQRITQKARAAGIHLIVATQRPSTDIIRGSIKNNIPVRIAFKVASAVDSVTILDHGGADKLLGLGDMLYSSGISEQRLQGAFVTDKEINRVTAYLRQSGTVNYLFTEEQLQKEVIAQETGGTFNDEMFEEVARYVVENNNASNNRLTQVFNMGFNRTNDMLNEMERVGIVSGTVRGKQREVLVTLEELEEILEKRQKEFS